MTRDEFIQKTYLAAMRKATPPEEGTPKFDQILGIGNILIEEWQNEPNTDWESLRQTTVIGKVTAKDRFSFDTETIRKISVEHGDYVELVATDGTIDRYRVVKYNQVQEHPKYVARLGDTLVFPAAFETTDTFIGADIKVPNFGFAPILEKSKDLVPVDQPLWLVYMAAAEYVRNDYIKQGQYANLVDKAQNIMNSMKAINAASQENTVEREPLILGESW